MLGTNKLGRVEPGTGVMQEFPLPDPGARPRRLAVTGDGIVYYTDNARGYLGALNPANGAVREWRSPTPNSGPYGITIGTDGRVWYNEASSSLVVAFDPRTERMETVPIPTPGCVVRHMVTDTERRRLWLALSGTGRIGRIDLP
jgi:virginiamycin B lyase